MKRDAHTLPLDLGNELIIDNFAGGGGTSTGLEAAFRRPVDIAINHNPEALAMHALNHPHTKHLCESVWDVDPIKVTGNRPVGLVWLSPDCKHFSKAKGGTPVSKHIRGLAWVGLRWVALTKPRVLMLENVSEFTTWGPVIIGEDGKAYPDPKRKGRTFESFVRQLRQHGYSVDWRDLRACDNGAPTIRTRLFLVARRDGLPIVFPEPTHGEPTSREVMAGMLAPYRTAAECIDFDLPAESIFDRKKELAVNTQRRVAKGLWRHVLSSAKPFIVTNTTGHSGSSIDAPLSTVTTGGHHMLGQPVMEQIVANEGVWQRKPIFPTPPATAERPHEFCCTTCGNTFPGWRPDDEGIPGACPTCGNEAGIYPIDHTVSAPFMTGAGGPTYSGKPTAIDQPLGTLTTENHRALVTPTLAPLRAEHAIAGNQSIPVDGEGFTQQDARLFQHIKDLDAAIEHERHAAYTITPLRGTSKSHMGGHSVEQPLSVVSAGGTHHALVSAEMVTAHIQRDMGKSVGHPADVPLGTVTAGGGGKSSLVGAHLITIGYGEREGQQARAQNIESPLGTIVTANKHAVVAAHITKFRSDSTGSAANAPMPTVTANSFIKRPGGSAPLGVVAAHLTHLTHHGDRAGTTPAQPLPTVTGAHRGEQALVSASLIDIGHGESCSTGAKRWGSGVRSLEKPLNAVTASSVPSALTAAFFEQANGGFWNDNDGRAATDPLSTIASKGANQRLVTAYLVRYNPEAKGSSSKPQPGDVELKQISADCLSEEQLVKARQCAELLHEHLPEYFPRKSDMVLMTYGGVTWVLVDITLRMLKARELFRAQAFPDSYIIHEIPDPELLFKDGVQVADPLSVPRIPLTATAQIRMVGNSVSPVQAKAMVLANFAHERLIASAAA
jgi:DNA (cytosine-5)-methyltransferase 1